MIKYFYNFYGAIFIAFFFSLSYSYNQGEFTKGIWIKKEQLKDEQSIKEAISNAYRYGFHNAGKYFNTKEPWHFEWLGSIRKQTYGKIIK